MAEKLYVHSLQHLSCKTEHHGENITMKINVD